MLNSGRVVMDPGNDMQLEYYSRKIAFWLDDCAQLFKFDGVSPIPHLAAIPQTNPEIISKLQTAFSTLQRQTR